jgi:hypothetical protein
MAVANNDARYRDDYFDALKEFFSDSEIVELTWVSALFCMVNRFHDSLHLDLDVATTVRDVVVAQGLTRSDLIDYAKRLVSLLESQGAGLVLE